MKKDDLRIIDIGRSFLFSSSFQFNPQKGYLPKTKNFTRFPKFEETGVVSEKLLSKVEKNDYEKRLFLVDDFGQYNILKDECSRKNTLLWKKHIKSLEKELDIEGISVVDIGISSINKISGSEEIFKEIDFLDLEIFKDNLKIIKEIGITPEELLNYFISNHPLPQQVSDYHKSFLISYIVGTIVASSFDFSKTQYLIVVSEWFKSGFLDKSGFIYAFGGLSKVQDYSFDSTGIWKMLLNEGKEEFEELQYINRKVFQPEFCTIETDVTSIRYVDENEKVVNYTVSKDKQNYINGYEGGAFESQIRNECSNIFLNISDVNIRQIKNVDNFKEWYTFYKYNEMTYVPLDYSDRFDHIVEVESDFDNNLQLYSGKDVHYHDFSHFDKIQPSNIVVTEGEKIESGDTLVDKQIFGGAFSNRVRARVSGVVEKVDYDSKTIVIKSSEKFNYLANFDYEVLEKTSRNKVRIKVSGFRLDLSFFSQQNSAMTFLREFKKDMSIDKFQTIWTNDTNQLRSLLSNLDTNNLPAAIIAGSIGYKDFIEIANKYSKIFSKVQFIIANGFGDRSFDKHQLRILKINEGMNTLIDPSENSIYILSKKAKFDSSRPPVVFHQYSRAYTFDDWNLLGEVIYNDKDSRIFKSYDAVIIDVAEFNLINFNKISENE